MALPVITDHWHAMAVFQGVSGLPEDRFVNNFYFRNDDIPDNTVMLNAVTRVVQDFYDDTDTQGTVNPPGLFMPGNGLQGATLKLYDLGFPPPRVPLEAALDISLAGTDPLPYEVSVVASFHNGGPGPRNRGRIYLGPLNQSALIVETGFTRVNPDLQQALIESMERMQGTSENLTWVQLSQANAETYPVAGGWVDNAFDTQRSRGIAPSARQTWGSPVTTGQGGFPGGRGTQSP